MDNLTSHIMQAYEISKIKKCINKLQEKGFNYYTGNYDDPYIYISPDDHLLDICIDLIETVEEYFQCCRLNLCLSKDDQPFIRWILSNGHYFTFNIQKEKREMATTFLKEKRDNDQ